MRNTEEVGELAMKREKIKQQMEALRIEEEQIESACRIKEKELLDKQQRLAEVDSIWDSMMSVVEREM